MVRFVRIVGEEVQAEVGELGVSHPNRTMLFYPKGDGFEIIELPKQSNMEQVTIDKSQKIIWHTPGFPADEIVELVKLYPGYSLHEYEEEEEGQAEEEKEQQSVPQIPFQPVPGWWQEPWYGVPQPNTGGFTVPPYIAWNPTLVDGCNRWEPTPGPFDGRTKQQS